MAKAIVNLDYLKSVYVGRIFNVMADFEIEQGSLVAIGDLVDGQREIYNPAAVTDATTEKVALIASDEADYDPRKAMWEDFTNEADYPAKAYELKENDVFTISEDGFTGTPEVGKYLITSNNSLKGKIADDLTDGTAFAAKIIDLPKLGFNRIPAIRVQVVKNG